MVGGTTPQADGPSRVDVTRREFARRLAAHGHGEREIERLWSELSTAEHTAGRSLGLGPLIAVYLGALLVMAAFASLVGTYWTTLDPWGTLALGGGYLVAFVAAGELLRRRRLVQPAALLQVVAVGLVAVVTCAAERAAGLWPDGAARLGYIHGGITGMAVAALAAATLLLVLRPDPLILVPLGVATAMLAADLAELLLGNDVSRKAKLAFVLTMGVAWIGGGLRLDATGRRRYATAAHWVGLGAAGVGLIGVLAPPTVSGLVLIGVLGALSLFFSALVRHWSFTVVGGVGVLSAVGGLLGRLGGGAPVAIAVLGVLFILLGLRWSRWRDPIRDALLARLPTRTRAVVTRLAP